MEKLIAFMLIAALIFCCVGCTPEVPEVTDPSGTKPTETDPTGSDQTDGTEDPTDSDEPEVLKYSWEQIDFHLGSRYVDGPATIFIFTSPEELQNSHYEEYEFAEKYDQDFFETKTLIVGNFWYGPPVGHVVSDFVQNEDGTYLLKIERLSYGIGLDVEFGTTVVIEVDALLDPDAEIIVEITDRIIPEDERPHKDVFEW